MIEQSDLARVDILVLIDQHMVICASDRLPVGAVFGHRLDDEWHHVGKVDRTGLAKRALVDAEIFDGLGQYFVIGVDIGRKCLGIKHALLGTAYDVENVRVLIPVHTPIQEDAPLLGRVPEWESVAKTSNRWVAFQETEREGVKRHHVQTSSRRQLKQARDSSAHLVCGLPRERHGEDAARVDALPGQVHKTAGQSAGLPGTRPGECHLHGGVRSGGGGLCWVEASHVQALTLGADHGVGPSNFVSTSATCPPDYDHLRCSATRSSAEIHCLQVSQTARTLSSQTCE